MTKQHVFITAGGGHLGRCGPHCSHRSKGEGQSTPQHDRSGVVLKRLDNKQTPAQEFDNSGIILRRVAT